MAYTPPPASDGTPRPVVPCVRLGAMMEAALPTKGSSAREAKTVGKTTEKANGEKGKYEESRGKRWIKKNKTEQGKSW